MCALCYSVIKFYVNAPAFTGKGVLYTIFHFNKGVLAR